MDIDGVGDGYSRLIEKGVGDYPGDLYRLSADSLEGLDRMWGRNQHVTFFIRLHHPNKQRLFDFYMRLEFGMSVKQLHGLWRPLLVASAG